MKTIKVIWKSATPNGHYVGGQFETKKEGFFASTPVLISEEVYNQLEVGDEVEVPNECLS